MRLAVNLGYFGLGMDDDFLPLTQEAERLGYSCAWVAEAYGSDAPSILGWLAGQTERIGLGSAILQIPARTPAMTAMTAATLDHLSAGRFHLGLGVSGPQVSEGWHGVRFGAPLGRTREYVEIVRMALARETVRHAGTHFTLPLPDGPGKALKLTIRPPRADLPVYLAAIGPKNLELAGEIADGWLAIFLCPEQAQGPLQHIHVGRERRGAATGGRALEGFDVVATVPVVATDDLELGRAAVADYTALYVGGMGSSAQNFYNRNAIELGYGEAARQIQEHYLAGRHRDAANAVPLGLVDDTALIGGRDRLRDRLVRYAEAGVTTLAVAPFAADRAGLLHTLRVVAGALEDAGLRE